MNSFIESTKQPISLTNPNTKIEKQRLEKKNPKFNRKKENVLTLTHTICTIHTHTHPHPWTIENQFRYFDVNLSTNPF